MRLRALLALALLCAAGPAQAVSAILHFDGYVNGVYGSGPSLRDALTGMIGRRADRLPIVDPSGRAVGAIALSDLVR